jgi:acylglycerol lipase
MIPRASLAPALCLALAMLTSCVGFDSGATPAPAGLTAETGAPAGPALTADRFVTADGAALPLRQWLPGDQPRAVILALHGFNDYSNAFTTPAAALVTEGIAVYAYDQRGFGAAPLHGRWAGDEVMTEDAILAASLLRQRHPQVPIFLLGESMGGAVAILAATGAKRADIDGVILSAPAVWGRQTMNIFERAGLWLANLLPAMQLSGRSVPYEVHPSDNIPMLRALGADPLVIKETRTDSLKGLVDLMSAALNAAPHLEIPALLLYGARDDIVPKGALSRFVEALPSRARAGQQVAFYPNGYHMLLRDLHADIVLGDIAAWVAAPRAGLPSGADRDARAAITGRPETSQVATAP